jgi:hypothetical protein
MQKTWRQTLEGVVKLMDGESDLLEIVRRTSDALPPEPPEPQAATARPERQ